MKPSRLRNRLGNRLTCSLAALTLAAIALAPADAADVTSRELKDGLFLFQGAGSNVLALADGGKLLVVDGGLDANSGDLLVAIEAATGARKIGTLIDTHWHPEQLGLNDEAGADGATILAHEQTALYLRHEVASALSEGPIGPLPEAARPTATTRGNGALTFAGHEVVYGYLPAAHTNGDLYVYFEDLDVLAAGGAAGSDAWPLLDYRNGAFIGGLLGAYEKLAGIVDDDTVVIPAQGPAITGAELKQQRYLYRQLFRDLDYMMNKGMGYDDVVALNPLKGREDRLGDPSRFLDGAYRSLQMTYVPD